MALSRERIYEIADAVFNDSIPAEFGALSEVERAQVEHSATLAFQTPEAYHSQLIAKRGGFDPDAVARARRR